MKDLFFWLQWKSSYRTLYVALLILFLASIASVVFAYMYGDIYTIGWNTTGEWKNITLSLDVFSVNQFDISQESQQYLLQKRYIPGNLTIHPWISYTHLAVILVAFVCFLTIISYLDLWLYIAGMTLFIFFIVSMHTEQIGIFGLFNRIPTAAILIIFGGITYYFNAYGKNIGLFIRLGVLSITTILFITAILFSSQINVPLLYVANYSITIPIIISILFMFVVGYDILQFLVVITSFGKSEFKTSSNSIWSFIIIGALYIGNLYLVYYNPDFIKEMGIVLLRPFAVLAISAILGIWLFEMKEDVKSVIPFKPLGAILYLTIGIITFSTIAFGYATANDALITTLEYSALYIQIGMGLGIFLYVITNFWNRYKKQEEVYKQFYITYQVPFFVGRGMGWVIVMYFVFSSNRFVFNSGKAGYYNNVADIYLYTEQDDLAVSFYKQAYTYEFQNQRTNYSLGNFYEQRNDKENAFKFYESTLVKKPTQYAYASLSSFYINNNQLFPAMFMLQDGLKKYPNDPHLLNNLGYLYTKFDSSDSAVYYFTRAAALTDDDIPKANLLTYFGAQGKFAECAAIIKEENAKPSETYLANKIGVATLQGKKEATVLPAYLLSDTTLTSGSFTYLYNYTFNKLAEQDTLLDYTLERYTRYADNAFYIPNLLYAKAVHLYYSQTNVDQAMILMRSIIDIDKAPVYIITLAHWQLKAGLFQQAYDTYDMLKMHPDQRMVAYKCLAAMDYGDVASVRETIKILTGSQIGEVASIAATLQASIEKPSPDHYKVLTDKQKVQCLHYHTLSAPEFILFKNMIEDPIQSLLLDLQHIQALNEQHNYAAALSAWNALNKPSGTPEEIIAQANLEYLKILAGYKQWDALAKELKTIPLLTKDLGYKDYFTALTLQNSKDSLQALPYYKLAVAKIGYVLQLQLDYARYVSSTIDEVQGLEKLIEAKKVIAYSKPLSMAYIEACIHLGLYKSAEDELQNISSTLSLAEITAIQSRFFTASAIPE